MLLLAEDLAHVDPRFGHNREIWHYTCVNFSVSPLSKCPAVIRAELITALKACPLHSPAESRTFHQLIPQHELSYLEKKKRLAGSAQSAWTCVQCFREGCSLVRHPESRGHLFTLSWPLSPHGGRWSSRSRRDCLIWVQAIYGEL